jgi:hypothetical protein
MRLVAAARASASRAQALADRAAALLFYVAVVSGGITFAYWLPRPLQEHRSFRFRAEGLVFIKRQKPIGTRSPLFRYGENSGDSMHAEAHFGTSCHYQIFF